jgi:predicted nucleic acid-binding protein
VIYLLDTNAISDWMAGDPRFENWLQTLRSNDHIVTCTVARGEILFGIARLPPDKRRLSLEQAANQVFAVVRCLSIPPSAAGHYATVKVTQQRLGLSLDENDLWIAATVLATDATLVSRDKDVARVGGLSVVALS